MTNNQIQKLIKKRIKVFIALMFIGVLYIIFRIGYLQIIEGPSYKKDALYQQYKDEKIEPARGSIYDSTYNELAVSVKKKDLWIELSNLKDDKKAYALEKIPEIINMKKEDVEKLIYSDKERILIAKNLDSKQVMLLRQAKIKGIWLEDTYQRIYPKDEFASYVIGHVSSDEQGLSGVEAYYDDELKGVNGRKVYSKDAKGVIIKEFSQNNIDPINGKSVVLTIDSKIQYHMEQAATAALEFNKAKRVTIISMDPKTGDVLGMTSKPDYNPNNPKEPTSEYFKEMLSEYSDEDKINGLYKMWRNPAVNDAYEPGSPMKLITGSAAIEENLTYMSEPFYDSGSIQVLNKRIKNWRPRPFGAVDLMKSMEQSINTTFVKLAQRLGSEKMHSYMSAFGYGKKTGIDLPGEGEGRVYPVENMGPLELATTAFGQSIAATPLQVLNSVCAVANGGILMKPRVVKEMIDEKEKEKEKISPIVIKQAVSKETADIILDSMRSVVQNGGSKVIGMPTYDIGAKTGTAQKVVNGKYEQGSYIASMVAVAPISDPKIAIIVIVDEPRNSVVFGSTVAGPVVADVFKNVFTYLRIEPIEKENSRLNEMVVTPNIVNMTLNEALPALNALELSYIIGNDIDLEEELVLNGKIVKMFPEPGQLIKPNDKVLVYLSYEKTLNGKVIMPDFTGKTIKQCQIIAESLGLKLSASGTGKSSAQIPLAGEIIENGGLISIEFK